MNNIDSWFLGAKSFLGLSRPLVERGGDMIKILLYIWQLPQNMVGFVLTRILRAKKDGDVYRWKLRGGISLGSYIMVREDAADFTIKHEHGHQKQSRYLGWLYLVAIGLPSIIWASLKTIGLFKKKNYYWFYTEKWANKLAGLEQ